MIQAILDHLGKFEIDATAIVKKWCDSDLVGLARIAQLLIAERYDLSVDTLPGVFDCLCVDNDIRVVRYV